MSSFWEKLKKTGAFLEGNKSDNSQPALKNENQPGNFWEELEKPFFCLAPMEEVTDVVFREMFAKYSGGRERADKFITSSVAKAASFPSASAEASADREGEEGGTLKISAQIPQSGNFGGSTFGGKDKGLRMNNFVMYTEFVNVDGLTHPEGFKRLSVDLKFTQNQRPVVAQLWGRSPLLFEKAAGIVADMGFDGVDINMGCPQDREIGLGSCAALIREPQLAVEIIKFAKRGARGLPVSVKTRIGYNENSLGTWLRHLLSANPAAIAVHGRTKKDKSKVPADWTAISEAVKIRNAEKSKTLIIGNGDVQSYEDGLQKIKETKVDGVMVGRGAFGNPWFFAKRDQNANVGEGLKPSPTASERLRVMLEHAEAFDREFSGVKSFFIMRKHFKAYCSGFDGAHELRAKLLQAKSLEDTKQIVREYLESCKL